MVSCTLPLRLTRAPKPPTRFLPAPPAGGGAASTSRRQRSKAALSVAPKSVPSLPFMDITPFPANAIVRLRYTAAFSLPSHAVTGGLLGTSKTFQPNSAFEPYDGQTTQPYGFDQMAALYGKYKVLSADLQLSCVAPTAPDSTMVQVLSQSPSGAISLVGADGGLTAARPNVATIIAQQYVVATYRRNYAMHELLGVTKREFDANTEEYAAAVGSNPVRMPTITLQACTLTSNTISTTAVLLVLEQTVMFFERVGQALS